MQIETKLGAHLESYLALTVSEVKLTASNIANIDTPGYRTLGFNFVDEMRQALVASEARRNPGPHLEEVQGLISRPDGNNVSMDREGLHLAEDQLKFSTGVELLRLENRRIMNAIHDDR